MWIRKKFYSPVVKCLKIIVLLYLLPYVYAFLVMSVINGILFWSSG